MSGWLTMDSAPRDGTKIDLWVSYDDVEGRDADCWWEDGKWVSRDSQGGPWAEDLYGEPTHWMPIPHGPVAADNPFVVNRLRSKPVEYTRPAGSNADEWHLFLCEYLDNRANRHDGLEFIAVQIAEAIDAAERRGKDQS